MGQISRRYNFQDGTKAIADQVDEELDQLIENHNDVDTRMINHSAKQVDPTSNDPVRDKHLSNLDLKSVNDQISDIYTGGLDPRYYTKTDLEPYLTGGDTLIVEETFTIVSANLGNNTFSYSSQDGDFIGTIDENGNQIFELRKGFYELGNNRIYAMINDTLRRSVSSGGLIEVDTTHISISPQTEGKEITFVYFQRVGITGEHNLVVGSIQPPQGGDNTIWFKVVG